MYIKIKYRGTTENILYYARTFKRCPDVGVRASTMRRMCNIFEIWTSLRETLFIESVVMAMF